MALAYDYVDLLTPALTRFCDVVRRGGSWVLPWRDDLVRNYFGGEGDEYQVV